MFELRYDPPFHMHVLRQRMNVRRRGQQPNVDERTVWVWQEHPTLVHS